MLFHGSKWKGNYRIGVNHGKSESFKKHEIICKHISVLPILHSLMLKTFEGASTWRGNSSPMTAHLCRKDFKHQMSVFSQTVHPPYNAQHMELHVWSNQTPNKRLHTPTKT